MEVSSAEKYENASREAVKARCGAVLVTQIDVRWHLEQPKNRGASRKKPPPSDLHFGRVYVTLGGLMSYGADDTESYQRAAVVTTKQNTERCSKPADLPVERPRKFEFVINLKAAKEIGLTIPPTCWRGRTR